MTKYICTLDETIANQSCVGVRKWPREPSHVNTNEHVGILQARGCGAVISKRSMSNVGVELGLLNVCAAEFPPDILLHRWAESALPTMLQN